MRTRQPEGTRGSLKWMQRAVEGAPQILNSPSLGPIGWLSPLSSDDYAEYSDGDFLALLGLLHLQDDLRAYWPRRGPQWDALGRCGDTVVIAEAKAHLGEFKSPPTAAKGNSRAMIDRALEETKHALEATGSSDWATSYYQYTNRLAHLHFLRRHGIDAQLLLIGFIGDSDMNGPETAAEWQAAYREADRTLGLGEGHTLSSFVHHVFPQVGDLM